MNTKATTAFPPTSGGNIAYMKRLHARGHGNLGQFDPTALEPKTRKPYAVVNVWFDGTTFEQPVSVRRATLYDARKRLEQQLAIANLDVIARVVIYDVRTGEVVA
jgi:hypothetical protein